MHDDADLWSYFEWIFPSPSNEYNRTLCTSVSHASLDRPSLFLSRSFVIYRSQSLSTVHLSLHHPLSFYYPPVLSRAGPRWVDSSHRSSQLHDLAPPPPLAPRSSAPATRVQILRGGTKTDSDVESPRDQSTRVVICMACACAQPQVHRWCGLAKAPRQSTLSSL